MPKADKRNLPYWYDLAFIPAQICYVPNAEAWGVFCKQIGVEEPYPMAERVGGGNCTTFEGTKVRDMVCVITFKVTEESTLPSIVGIIAHEVVHASQYIMRYLENHHRPAERHDEIEAYIVQYGTQAVFKTYTEIIA